MCGDILIGTTPAVSGPVTGSQHDDYGVGQLSDLTNLFSQGESVNVRHADVRGDQRNGVFGGNSMLKHLQRQLVAVSTIDTIPRN